MDILTNMGRGIRHIDIFSLTYCCVLSLIPDISDFFFFFWHFKYWNKGDVSWVWLSGWRFFWLKKCLKSQLRLRWLNWLTFQVPPNDVSVWTTVTVMFCVSRRSEHVSKICSGRLFVDSVVILCVFVVILHLFVVLCLFFFVNTFWSCVVILHIFKVVIFFQQEKFTPKSFQIQALTQGPPDTCGPLGWSIHPCLRIMWSFSSRPVCCVFKMKMTLLLSVLSWLCSSFHFILRCFTCPFEACFTVSMTKHFSQKPNHLHATSNITYK